MTTSQWPREGAHCLDVTVVADGRRRDHLRGGGVRRLGEDAEGDGELGGRAGAHPRQLATADDADDRESAWGALWGGHCVRISVAAAARGPERRSTDG